MRPFVAGISLVFIGGVLLSHPQEQVLFTNPEKSRTDAAADWFSEDDGWFETSLQLDDFLQTASVRDALDWHGLSTESSREDLLSLLPEVIYVRGNLEKMRGSAGEDAGTGAVAFSMSLANGTADSTSIVASSFNMIVNVNGTIEHMETTFGITGSSRSVGFKFSPADPDQMLVALENTGSEQGSWMTWNYRASRDGSISSKFEQVAGGRDDLNCRDIQMSASTHSFWGISDNTTAGFARYGPGGDVLEYYDLSPVASDLDHVQLIEDDTQAIVSDKRRNFVAKFDLTTESLVWVAGGAHGSLSLVDEDGHSSQAGESDASLFHGQHSGEYFGDNEYFVFDNRVEWDEAGGARRLSNQSRLMIVKVDEEEDVAQAVWHYDLGFHTPYFGDCDRLATGNILSAGWVDPTAEISPGFDAAITEIERDTKETVWELKVTGSSGNTTRGSPSDFSWRIHNAERIYPKPLVSNLECAVQNPGHVTVSFNAQNRFKQNTIEAGKYTVYSRHGHVVAEGSFSFKPHLQATSVRTSVSVAVGNAAEVCEGSVQVINQWNDKANKHFSSAPELFTDDGIPAETYSL